MRVETASDRRNPINLPGLEYKSETDLENPKYDSKGLVRTSLNVAIQIDT